MVFKSNSQSKEFVVKSKLKLILGASALLALAGCASAGGPVYYDGYYDGFYGPLYDGYWGDDNFFYYSGGVGRPFVRDEGNHFRHDAAPGINSFHYAAMGHP